MTKDDTSDKGRLLQSALESELDALPPSERERLTRSFRKGEPLTVLSPEHRKRLAETVERLR